MGVDRGASSPWIWHERDAVLGFSCWRRTGSKMLCRWVSIAALLVACRRFGDKVEFVHCINMIPFTPITEELLLYEFMEQEWPVLETAFDGRDPGEKDRIF